LIDLIGTENDRSGRYEQYRDYYDGRQRRQIAIKTEQADDNLVENFAELIVDRSVSMLLGGGVKLELGDEAVQDWVDEWMEANDLQILLHDAVENGSVFGTAYVKIMPDGVESRQRPGVMLPRLVALDPQWMRIITPVEDIGRVTGYEMTYQVEDETGEMIVRRETIRAVSTAGDERPERWTVTNYVANKATRGRFEQVGEVVDWLHAFGPIVHWKSLPNANDVYGKSDLESILELQDRLNFVAGNISKIIRYHAHPKTWGRGAGLGSRVSWGADEIVLLNGENAMLENLEMQTDLSSSRAFYGDLREALFAISRTVDLNMLRDHVGQLTNFGLRVMYSDALAKLGTKRQLAGRGLQELAYRALALHGMYTSPARVVWPDPLPISEIEAVQADGFDVDRGLVSHQTMSEHRGYDWEREQARMGDERAGEDNVGAAILRAFERGAGQ